MSSTSTSKTLAGDRTQSLPESRTWTAEDEVKLMRAVAEIAAEPVESFDPTVSPFARIEKTLSKPFTRPQILAKVKDLRRRYEDHETSASNGDGEGGAHDGEVVEISHKVWGPAIDLKKETKVGRKMKRRKKTKRRDIFTLLSVTSSLAENNKKQSAENETLLQKHFLAIISSSTSQCTSSSSSSTFPICMSRPGRLTENMDLMVLRQSSDMLSRALGDVNQKHQEQNQGELVEDSNQNQIKMISVVNQEVAQSYIADSPVSTGGPHSQALLTESSCRVAENRFRLALNACIEGEGPVWASSAFSLCSDVQYHSPSRIIDTMRPQNSKFQSTEVPFEQMGLGTEFFQPSSSPIVEPDYLAHSSLDCLLDTPSKGFLQQEYDRKSESSLSDVGSPMDTADNCQMFI